MLAEINAKAAASKVSYGTVSPKCSVCSLRVDGSGLVDIEGRVEVRTLMFGRPLPNSLVLAKSLGFDSPVICGMTFDSTRPGLPFAPCKPRIIVPDGSNGYALSELLHEDFGDSRAIDVNNAGIVVGDGNPAGHPHQRIMWTCPLGGNLVPTQTLAEPGEINESGAIAARIPMHDGSQNAVLWQENEWKNLGTYRGRDSAARAINSRTLVVGWVCLDSVNRGQINHRPAAWLDGKLLVLDGMNEFGCDWGQAIDVNDRGTVLVVGHRNGQCRTLVWNPLKGNVESIGRISGIDPLAISLDGTVLGMARGEIGTGVACVAKPGNEWCRLGTEPGFYATALNNGGDVVGTSKQDGCQRPWLRKATGEIIWLPYFEDHWCRPASINEYGVIVGSAITDHGTHALVWTTDEKK
jgi:hypothetical protein